MDFQKSDMIDNQTVGTAAVSLLVDAKLYEVILSKNSFFKK